jgi:hypothetical protein
VLFGDVADFRPVLPIEKATVVEAQLTALRVVPESNDGNWGGNATISGGLIDGDAFGRAVADLTIQRRSADRRTLIAARGAAGAAVGHVAPQSAFLLGGRNTLPGYPYRGFAGDVFALADVSLEHAILQPFLGLRLSAAAGWASPIDPVDAPAEFLAWPIGGTDGIRPSVGAGVAIFYDILRLDLHRGLRGGGWTLLLSVRPDLWGML